jgi:hypothetical protein
MAELELPRTKVTTDVPGFGRYTADEDLFEAALDLTVTALREEVLGHYEGSRDGAMRTLVRKLRKPALAIMVADASTGARRNEEEAARRSAEREAGRRADDERTARMAERFRGPVDDAAERRAMFLEALCTRCGETFNPADEHDLEHLVRAGDGEPCGGAGELLGGYHATPPATVGDGYHQEPTTAEVLEDEAVELYFAGDDGAATWLEERDAALAEHSARDAEERALERIADGVANGRAAVALERSAPVEARIAAWLAAVIDGRTPAEELRAIMRDGTILVSDIDGNVLGARDFRP